MPVHAGSFLRRRKMTLDTALLGNQPELRRILIHELFHFVWLRLGNARRREWEERLREEMKQGARGELGWSSAMRKELLSRRDWRVRSRRWREYICESFCDTAAWQYGGDAAHEEFTLGVAASRRRAESFQSLMIGLIQCRGLTV
jgi:hypothetical protein